MLLKNLIILVSVLSVTACAPKGGGGSSSGGSGASAGGGSSSVLSTSSSGSTTSSNGTQNSTMNVGLMNFDEINANLGQLTGIAGDPTSVTLFKSIKNNLPADNNIQSFSFMNQMAITSLASQYCSSLVSNANYSSQRTAAFGTFSLTAIPTVAFPNAAAQSALANQILMAFWGPSYASQPSGQNALTQISAMMASLLNGAPNTAATTQNVVVAACAASLSTTQTNTL